MIYIIKFKDIPNEERPRERLLLYGANCLSNEELLMIFLKTGTRGKSVKELAMEVLSVAGGMEGFRYLTLQKLKKIEGVGMVKGIEILALVEFSKRINASVSEREFVSFTEPRVIVSYFNDLYRNEKQELFYCVYLDQKKKFISKKKLFVGTISSSLVHPREIFKEAYMVSASFIICIHNHPSGDPSPSQEDILVTSKLKELGELHAIYLVDHLVIGHDCYYSFFENHCILNNN